MLKTFDPRYISLFIKKAMNEQGIPQYPIVKLIQNYTARIRHHNTPFSSLKQKNRNGKDLKEGFCTIIF